MGLVALELKRRIAPGRDLAFRLLKARNLSPGDDQPVLDSDGRMRAGSLLLTEPRDANSLVAVVAILESSQM
jgi:hypothetical protein